jgi:hypothetical protein
MFASFSLDLALLKPLAIGIPEELIIAVKTCSIRRILSDVEVP